MFAPDDDLGGGGLSNPLDDDDILNEDDDKKDKDDVEDDDKVVPDGDKEDEDDDDKEKEDEEDEDDDKKKEDDEEETDEEKAETDRITHASDLKKAYPDIFKKFPDVRAALYRDSRYSEIFADPAEAEVAAQHAASFRGIENELAVQGDPTELLKTLKKNVPEAYEKVVVNTFLYAQENDKEGYIKLAALPIKQLLRRAFKEGKGADGKPGDLGKAALWIHNYFFQNYDLDEKVELEDKLTTKREGKSKREQELEEKLARIDQREYNDFKGSVDNSYVDSMTKFIRPTLDKDTRLTDWTKSKVIEEILVDINQQLSKDTRHTKSMESLWKQAQAQGFTSEFKPRIVNAALARAKSLVATVRAKKVSEALGKKSKDKDKDDNVTRFKSRDKDDRRDKSSHRDERRSNRDKGSDKKLSDLDILRGA